MREGNAHRDDFQHLLPRDVAVAVEVVHAEGPLKLLLQFAARGDAQGAEEFPEVDCPVPVGVERPKDVLCKLITPTGFSLMLYYSALNCDAE